MSDAPALVDDGVFDASQIAGDLLECLLLSERYGLEVVKPFLNLPQEHLALLDDVVSEPRLELLLVVLCIILVVLHGLLLFLLLLLSVGCSILQYTLQHIHAIPITASRMSP
eukprot:4842897-Heterocapsa_arctica.AAC.1